jgi:type IX secretion system PorP/SprF family membrane protein
MKKRVKGIKYWALSIVMIFAFIGGTPVASVAQQLPVFTQFPSDELYFNPAVAGTKRIYDIRINYRDQWVGMPDAPITEGLSLNYRLLGGKMGLAGYIYQDVTGPTQRNDYTLCYAYHIKLPDLVISFGLAGSMMDYIANGSLITIHQQGDPAIDQAVSSHAWVPDASAGFFMYNDRWKLGLSASNLIQNNANLYETYAAPQDTNKAGVATIVPHFYGYLSYNFSGNPSYIWQSSLFASEASGTPLYLAYSMRLHIHDRFYVGLTYAVKDNISLDLGLIFRGDIQVCYSYDYITSALGSYTSGSHEITIIYSVDSFTKKEHRGDTFDSFQKRKFGYMF